MRILGIHDGHNSGATFLKDGVVVASVSEERISRTKNDSGYPQSAIEDALKIADCDKGHVDKVALATNFMHPKDFYQSFEWYKKGRKKQNK